jgi:hypothetical protein
VFSCHLCLGHPNGSFLQVYPPIPLTHMCHMLTPISSSLILSWFLLSTTNHGAPHYAVFSTFQLLPHRSKCLPRYLILEHPQHMFLPQCDIYNHITQQPKL